MTLHQVLLNAVDKTGYCLGWETEQAATYGTRSARVEFTLDVSPAVFDTVELKGDYGGSLYTVFKGVVTRVTQTLDGKSRICECLDYTYWLFFRLVFEKSYVNKKAHEIVSDLITTYYTDITTTNLATTFTTLYDKTFDKLTVFEAIRQVAEAEDADFWIRPDKDLYFKPRSSAAQAAVSLSQGANILEATWEQADDRLVNWLRFLGGVGYKPSDKDNWTENSGWDKSNGVLSYDAAVRYAGGYSVKHVWYSPDSDGVFWRPAAKDLGWVIGDDYTDMYMRLRCQINDPALLRLELGKDDSNYLYRSLSIAAADTWEQKQVPVGVGASGWTTVGSFAWATDPVNFIRYRWRTHSTDPIFDNPTATNQDLLYGGSITRAGQRLTLTDCVIKQIQFYVLKNGSPAGAINCTIRRASDDALLITFGSIDISSISSGWLTFNNSYEISGSLEVRIQLEYAGGNGLYVYYWANQSGYSGVYTRYQGGYTDNAAHDRTLKVYGGINRALYVDELYFYTPQIQVDKEDAASQASYRRRDALKSDDTVGDSVWAGAWAQKQIDLYKNPYKRLRVTATFLPGQVEAGQNIQVTIGDFGISGENYRVLACRHRVPEAVTELDLCPVLPLSLEEALARVRRELSDVIRRTA